MENKTSVLSLSLPLDSIGFITFIVFLILKVTGNWDIPWFWVWFPLWIPFAIGFVFFIIFLIIALVLARE